MSLVGGHNDGGSMTLVTTVASAALAVLLLAFHIDTAQAQSNGQGYAPVIVARPIVDAVDESYVSILSGKAQFTIPALQLGDVSYVPHSYNGQHFANGGVADHNYGSIEQCQGVLPSSGGYAGAYTCVIGNTSGGGIQALHGEERATFVYSSSGYRAYGGDGSKFVDNGSTCTWTKRDGTEVVYVAYHEGSNPICKSNNISHIKYPDGRIATYYYYGSFSTNVWAYSPILSIVTNTGYMLKYNYPGTPDFGDHTSVTAINRAFETCDPAAVTCNLTNAWPTATSTFQDKMVSTSDGFPSISPTYNPYRHYLFTIEEASHRKHVFELDSYFRVISYQPPGATTAQYTYKLCSNLVGDALRNCFGMTQWNHLQPFDMPPLFFDQVESVNHNGQTWQYNAFYTIGSLPYNSTWRRIATDPRGGARDAKGNSTPGTETLYGGSTVSITSRDGTVMGFAYTVANQPNSVVTPLGIKTEYAYDARGNLEKITRTPIPNSGQPVLVQSASYPGTCTNYLTCNKPTSVTDANLGTSNFEYDSTHGGVLKVKSPAVNGIRPEVTYKYGPRNAWYRDASGTMTKDTRAIYVLESESFCRTTSAAADGSCATPGDQVVTTYEYGPDSGPNNLILRGKAVTADGRTLRTCYGHDKQGNKIWETSPNANPSGCTDY
jgi:YD repeat-containing protein